MNRKRPWTWTKDLEVRIELGDEGPKDFKLVPMEPAKVVELVQDLRAAEEISQVFQSANEKFESGQADYKGALQRLKDLRDEWQLALNEQLMIARGIALLFEPSGLDREFGMFVNVLTQFAHEAAERALRKKPEDPPPPKVAPEPSAATA